MCSINCLGSWTDVPSFVGGPGGSGIGLIVALGQVFSDDFQGAYDLISWDPRGVGLYTL